MKIIVLVFTLFTISTTLLFAQPQLPFSHHLDNPVLTHGEEGFWDEGNILWSYIYYEDNIYYLFYSSSTNIWTDPVSIGLAYSSTDGYSFDKSFYNPVFMPDGSGFDAWSVSFPVMIKINEEYRLYYSGNIEGGSSSIGQASASSPDGLAWTRLDNPIIEPGSTGEWDSQGISPESVIQTDSGLLLFYSGRLAEWRVGMAYFNDSDSTWVKHDDPLTTEHPFAESDPVVEIGDPGLWDDETTALCSVNKIPAGLEMFYTGSSNNNFKIGYATSPDGITWYKDSDNPMYSYEDDPFAMQKEYHVVANPTVAVVDDLYYMYYDYGLMGPGYISLATTPVDPNQGFNYQIGLYSESSINILPNPVKEQTTIQYFIKSHSNVELSIHHLNGQLVSIIVNELQQEGEQEIVFKTTRLPAGIYFCKLKTDAGIQTTKIIKL